MSNTLYNYLDPDFNLQQAGNAMLLLLATSSHFSAAVVQACKLTAWVDDCPLDELLHPQELKSLFQANYQQVITGISSSKFTLWPKEVYTESQAADIARFLNVSATDTVFSDSFDLQNQVLFVANEPVVKALSQLNLTQQSQFGMKCWVKAIMDHHSSEQCIYINVNNQQIDILFVSENKVKFCNSFEFVTVDEAVYYVLLAAQQLKLDLTATYIKASGNVRVGGPYMSRLAEFFKGAELNPLKVIEISEQVPSHQILALSALSLCASLVEA
ncbi:hypothetical protein GCM10027037_02980 [Mucilaginibacter koreensis]